MIINKVDAICLLVSDLKKSREFYEDVLGLTVAITDQGFVEYKLGATPLALFAQKDATSMFPAKYMKIGGGAVIALHVQDVGQACKELGEKGIKVFEGPKTTPWNQEVVYLHDPDGYIIELTRYEQVA